MMQFQLNSKGRLVVQSFLRENVKEPHKLHPGVFTAWYMNVEFNRENSASHDISIPQWMAHDGKVKSLTLPDDCFDLEQEYGIPVSRF